MGVRSRVGALTDLAGPSTGLAGPVVVLGTLLASAALSPRFRWPSDPFSVAGRPGDPAAPLFTVGVVLGGLLAVAFAARLRRDHGRLEAALYAAVGLSFVLAGAFPVGSGLHGVVAAPIFLAVPLLLLTSGARRWCAGRRRAGLAWTGLGGLALLVWLPYDLGLAWAWIGFAAAELVAVGAFAVWSGWAATLNRGDGPTG